MEKPKKEVKRQKCMVYSRVTGWLTPVSKWNKGKTSEWKDRKPYDLNAVKQK
jgi:anaerobic ribonucleoside-triphosphate reductase